MRIGEIWRYPVKSLGGEQLESAYVGEHGITGDRLWGVRDVDTGLVLTARREPGLLFLSASYRDGERPRITTADGVDVADDAALSRHLARPVELVPAAAGPATFENPLDIDTESDWVQWQSAGHTFHDGRSTVSLVSTASIGEWHSRRFRANLVIDGAGEDDLTGDVVIGSTTLTIRKPISRCVMVTRAQPGIERDLAILKRIIAERSNLMGVGCVVTTPGHITIGDPVPT